jgi:hypothetical protein
LPASISRSPNSYFSGRHRPEFPVPNVGEAAGPPQLNCAPSSHMRCSTTASLRASATLAFFMPLASGDAQRLCGLITWFYRPPGAKPGPLRDIHNQDRPSALSSSSDCRSSKTPPRLGLTAGAMGRSTTPRAAILTNRRSALKTPTHWRLAVASYSSARARLGLARPQGRQTHEAACRRPLRDLVAARSAPGKIIALTLDPAHGARAFSRV